MTTVESPVPLNERLEKAVWDCKAKGFTKLAIFLEDVLIDVEDLQNEQEIDDDDPF